ncbi:hypothetical protein TB2_007298 [Malus domestica]
MAGREMTSNSHISSTGANNNLQNMNYSENFGEESPIPKLQPIEKSVKEVYAGSSSKITKTVEAYCKSGLELWVDLKTDSPQLHLDHMDLPQLTVPAPPQGSSPQADHLSNFGSQMLLASNSIQRASDLLVSVSLGAEMNRIKTTELASQAMEELKKLALAREPLWQVDIENNTEILSEIEYTREFGDISTTLMEIVRMVEVRESPSLPNLDLNNSEYSVGSNEHKPRELGGPKPASFEASREIGFVQMNPASIIELLMDLGQWSQAFSTIVSRASIMGVLSSTGVQGNYDGTLQVMTAEFQAPAPLIPTRESYFARYCKNLGDGMWGVVDVSLEKLFQLPSRNFRRQPSGCLIQEMPNGWSQVIWVEHVEVDNTLVHNLFKPLVSSGFAFSAKRWVTTLIGQRQWLETLTATRTTVAADGADVSSQGRRSLLKLSERMVRSFYIDNISGSAENKWMPLPLGWAISGAENVRISMKSSTDDPGKPPGSTVVFTTSINLPFPRKQVFSFLRDEKCRNEWDMLASNHGFDEYAYFANGKTPGNRVSILRAFKSNEVEIFYLQASYTDATGSYVVYAPIDMYAMTELINGGNPDNLAILASGFSILPDKPKHRDDTGGSLLTIAFHVAAGTSTQEHVSAHQHANLMYCVLASTVVSVEDGLQST